MEFALPLPQTNADAAVYVSAAFTALFGLFSMFAPRLALRALRLTTHSLHPEAIAEARSALGGFYLGIGLMGVMFFEQWTLPLVIGVAWLFASFGRLVSILSDQGSTAFNYLFLFFNLVLAALPLAAVFGFIPA